MATPSERLKAACADGLPDRSSSATRSPSISLPGVPPARRIHTSLVGGDEGRDEEQCGGETPVGNERDHHDGEDDLDDGVDQPSADALARVGRGPWGFGAGFHHGWAPGG